MPPPMYAAPPFSAANMQAMPPGTQIVIGHTKIPTMPLVTAPYQLATTTMTIAQPTALSTPQLNANEKPVTSAEPTRSRPLSFPPEPTAALQMHHIHAVPHGAQLVMSHGTDSYRQFTQIVVATMMLTVSERHNGSSRFRRHYPPATLPWKPPLLLPQR